MLRRHFSAAASTSIISHDFAAHDETTNPRLLSTYTINRKKRSVASHMLVGWARQNSAPSSSSSSSSFLLSRPLQLSLLLHLLLLLLPTMTPAFLLPSITSARMLRRSVSSWLKRGGATLKSKPCLGPSSVGLHSSSSSSSYNPLFDDVPDRR